MILIINIKIFFLSFRELLTIVFFFFFFFSDAGILDGQQCVLGEYLRAPARRTFGGSGVSKPLHRLPTFSALLCRRLLCPLYAHRDTRESNHRRCSFPDEKGQTPTNYIKLGIIIRLVINFKRYVTHT